MNLEVEDCVADSAKERTPVLTPNPRSLYERTADLRIDQQTRIRGHLLAVETQLREVLPPWLSPQQQARRDKMLDELAEYREEGVFPKNTMYQDGPRPVFIDEDNVHCAVGHLIKQSGHPELAQKVRDLDNSIYVPQLKDEAFLHWAQEHGLTPEECACIQPSYDYGGSRRGLGLPRAYIPEDPNRPSKNRQHDARDRPRGYIPEDPNRWSKNPQNDPRVRPQDSFRWDMPAGQPAGKPNGGNAKLDSSRWDSPGGKGVGDK